MGNKLSERTILAAEKNLLQYACSSEGELFFYEIAGWIRW